MARVVKLPFSTISQSFDWRAPAFAGLLVLAWTIPNHSPPWMTFHSEMLAIAAALVVAVSPREANVRALPTPVLFLFCVAIVPWVQAVAGMLPYRADAVVASGYLLLTALCFWLGWAGSERSGQAALLRGVMAAFIAASIISTGLALYQWFGLDWANMWVLPSAPGLRASANLAQPNQLATVMFCGLASIAAMHAQGRLGPLVSVLAASFVLLGMALTQSRTPWAGGLVVALVIALRRDAFWRPMRIPTCVVISLLLWYCVAFASVLLLPGSLLLTGVGAVDISRMEVGLRPLLWSQMLDAVALSPWAGYGWLQGHAAQAAAALDRPGLEYANYAHNLILDLVIWNGVPIGVLIGVATIIWYVACSRSTSGVENTYRFTVITFAIIHSMLEYPHAYAYFIVPVALLAGQLDRSRSSERLTHMSVALYHLICGLVFIGALTILIDYFPLESDRRVVQMWLVRIGGDRPIPPPPKSIVLDHLEASARWARRENLSHLSVQELEELTALTHRLPSLFHMRRLVLALILNGRVDEARVELARTRGLHGDAQHRRTILWLRQLADTGGPELRPFAAAISDLTR